MVYRFTPKWLTTSLTPKWAVTKSPLRSEVVDRVSIVEAILLIINPRELLLQQGRNLVAVRVRPVVVKCPHRSRQRLQAGE